MVLLRWRETVLFDQLPWKEFQLLIMVVWIQNCPLSVYSFSTAARLWKNQYQRKRQILGCRLPSENKTLESFLSIYSSLIVGILTICVKFEYWLIEPEFCCSCCSNGIRRVSVTAEYLIVSPFATIPADNSFVYSVFVLTSADVATTQIVVLILLVVTGSGLTLTRVCFVLLLLYFQVGN